MVTFCNLNYANSNCRDLNMLCIHFLTYFNALPKISEPLSFIFSIRQSLRFFTVSLYLCFVMFNLTSLMLSLFMSMIIRFHYLLTKN
jgi:hypothetical protein